MGDTNQTTVIICCAGMGTRLGIGTTKALMDICGKPLIIRQLEQLKQYDDIRIVVGFDAERVIRTVKEYRKDIMFAFNYEYEHTGTADSLRKALIGARDEIIALDGDTVINSNDFHKFLMCDRDCIAISKDATSEPMVADILDGKVVGLKKKSGHIQWSGVTKIKKEKLNKSGRNVSDILNAQMPMEYIEVQLKEINTQEDYEKAIEWYQSECNYITRE